MCTLHWQTHRVDGVDELAGLAELHETLPQVVEGPLHQNLLLLVVVQQVVPQRLLGEGFGVAHNDHTVPVGQECTASRVYPQSTRKETPLLLRNVFEFHQTKSHLALVSATLRRRGSLRKPMPWCSLALTHDRMMKSFSRPWKASTLAISTSFTKTETQKAMWKFCKLIKYTHNSERRKKQLLLIMQQMCGCTW